MCDRADNHDWARCPYAHEREKARRRDPARFRYAPVPCPDVLSEQPCARGDGCPYSHSVQEYWLHPDRFRTQMCKNGARCGRPLCFFAHRTEELRFPEADPAATLAALLAERGMAPAVHAPWPHAHTHALSSPPSSPGAAGPPSGASCLDPLAAIAAWGAGVAGAPPRAALSSNGGSDTGLAFASDCSAAAAAAPPAPLLSGPCNLSGVLTLDGGAAAAVLQQQREAAAAAAAAAAVRSQLEQQQRAVAQQRAALQQQRAALDAWVARLQRDEAAAGAAVAALAPPLPPPQTPLQLPHDFGGLKALSAGGAGAALHVFGQQGAWAGAAAAPAPARGAAMAGGLLAPAAARGGLFPSAQLTAAMGAPWPQPQSHGPSFW